MPEIRLVDLPVICRYSLAVRQEAAPAEEVLAVLDASREAVLAVLGEPPAGDGTPSRPKRSAASARTGATRALPRQDAAGSSRRRSR